MTALSLDKAAPGRDCGSCSLCCKLPYIEHPEFAKASAVWCQHCKPGSGCKIYDTRPAPCRGFHCYWLALPWLGEAWRPTTAKLLVCSESGNSIAVHVDPAFPANWRKEPYYSQLKKWSAVGVDKGMQVVVYIKDKATVILPNKEVELGQVAHEDIITVVELDPHAPIRDWNAYIVPAKDAARYSELSA